MIRNSTKGAYVGNDKNDENCKIKRKGKYWTLTHGLDQCGMALRFDRANDCLKYTVSSNNYHDGDPPSSIDGSNP